MDDKWTIDDIYSEDSDDEIKLHPGAICYRNDFASKIWKRKRSSRDYNDEVDYNDRNPLTPAFTKFIKPRKTFNIKDQPTSRLRKSTIRTSSLCDILGIYIPGDSQSKSYKCHLKEKHFELTDDINQKQCPSSYAKPLLREQSFSTSSGLDLLPCKPWSLHFAENEQKIWMGSFIPVTPIREEFVEYNNKRSTSTHTVKSTSSNSHERKLKTTTNCHGKLPPIPATTSTVSKISRRTFTYKEEYSFEFNRPVKSTPTSIVKHTGPSGDTKPIQRKQPESSEPNKQPELYLREPWHRYPGDSKQKKWMGDLKAVTPTRDKYSYVRNVNERLTSRPLDCVSLRTSYEKY